MASAGPFRRRPMLRLGEHRALSIGTEVFECGPSMHRPHICGGQRSTTQDPSARGFCSSVGGGSPLQADK
eukprot:366028-Chlamydomonas_euryale.AAC.41